MLWNLKQEPLWSTGNPVPQTPCWSWTKNSDQYPGLFLPPELWNQAEARCSATRLVHSKKCTPPSEEASPGRLSQNGVSGSHFQSRLADTVVCMLEWLSCHKSRYPFACVDFWRLNESVLRETHPLPKVDYTLAQLSGAMAFSTLDANSDF